MKLVSNVSLLVLVELVAVAHASLRDSQVNISSIDTDQAQIRLLVGAVEQAIQQCDFAALDQYVIPQTTPFEMDSLLSVQQHLIDSLYEVGSNLSQTFDSQHQGWQITPFSWFNFEIDTIMVSDSSATVRIHADWKRRVESDPFSDTYVLTLVRSGPTWQLENLSALAVAMGDFLSDNTESIKKQSETAPIGVKSSWDDYNQWLSNSAVHLLLERDVYPDENIARFTKQTALDQFEEKVFQCAGDPTCYYYEDPLTNRTLWVSAISDHCWQRFVVANLGDGDEGYIYARGRYGTTANLDEFAGPAGMEFRTVDQLYICDRGNNRIKRIEVPTTEPYTPTLLSTRTADLNEPTDLDVTRDGHVIVSNYGNNQLFCYCENMGCTNRYITNHWNQWQHRSSDCRRIWQERDDE